MIDAGHQPRRRAMDLLIAATAHAHRACLHTNADDFAGLEYLNDLVTAEPIDNTRKKTWPIAELLMTPDYAGRPWSQPKSLKL